MFLKVLMRVTLKVLNEKPNTIYKCSDHPDRCSKCPINVGNGGLCKGCSSEKLSACSQSQCDLGCNVCGGFKVDVPAVCCKSPIAKTFLIQAAPGGNYKKPSFTFTRRKAISFKSKAVVSARGGGINSSKGPPYIDELECVAATIKDVWSPRGFYSKDVKDYLRVPKSKKLIIISALLDDWLERMWDAQAFGQDFEEHGIDYWMPPAFSVYNQDGHMNRYWQMLRTLHALQIGKGHFVPLPNTSNFEIDDIYLDAIDKIPQATFNCQFAFNDERMIKALGVIRSWHQKVPKHVSFWMIGAGSPKFCRNIRKLLGDRDVYFVSANPFRLANHGKEMLPDGNGLKVDGVSKQDLLFKNQRTFRSMVTQWG